MKAIKKVLLIYRKKSNLLILGILFFLVFFLLMFMSIYNISRNNISAIEKTYGTSFSIEMIVDKADLDVWEERYIEGIGTLQAYTGPIVDEPLVSRIAEEVEGIIDFEAGSRVSVMLDEYDPIPGYWNWSYDYFSTHDSSFDSETIEKRKMHMYVTECWHLRNSFRYEQFYNGIFRLVEGRHITPEDTFKCIISKALAQKNDLKLGDTLNIDLHSLNVRASLPIESLGTVEAEIVGFFETTYKQSVGQYTNEQDILENWIITDNTTGHALAELCGDNHALAISQFYVENPEDLDEIMEQVKALDWIDWRYFELVKDDSTYKEAVKPLRTMKTIMIVSMIIVLTAGILLLYLVVTHSMKKRVRETGILMSLGITGKEIRKRFLLEYLIIGLSAFLLALVISFAVTPAIGNQIYGTINKEEQRIYTEEEIEAAIARGEHSKVAEMAKNQKTGVEPPKTIETKVTAMTVLVVLVIMMLIIYWSVDTVIKKTLKMEPMSILSMIR